MAYGLYFHIPFCMSKCPYCDFYSVKYDVSSAKEYVERICKEIKKYSGTFDTIYFGGGTPSALPARYIAKIIEESKKQFNILPNCEITVECNPSKDLKQDFKIYSSAGVNRVSIGMQSAVDKERFALGRSAGANKVFKTVCDAKNAGINNISLDVMLGTPRQTLQSLDETFDFVKKCDVSHISAYMLKIEEGTKFFELQDKLELPSDDEVAKMYLKTIDVLSNMGINQYEISNFSKPGFESRHNLKYWSLVPYLGIGATAHSFLNGKRFFYDKNFVLADEGDGGDDEERIMLGLRLNKGIKKSLINKDIEPYIKEDFIKEKGSNISLTPKGMLVSNSIIAELI